MVPFLWKALNLPDFIPQKQHLKRLIKDLKRQGRIKEANFLEDKYDDLLINNLPEPELTSKEAYALLDALLSPDYHSMFEKQVKDRYFVDGNGEIHYIDEDGVIIEEKTQKEKK